MVTMMMVAVVVVMLMVVVVVMKALRTSPWCEHVVASTRRILPVSVLTSRHQDTNSAMVVDFDVLVMVMVVVAVVPEVVMYVPVVDG